MRHEEDRPLVREQRSLEDLLAREVEVVRRLVEQEKVPFHEREKGEGDAAALAARQVLRLLLDLVAGEEERAEEAARLADRQARPGEHRLEHRAIVVQSFLGLREDGDLHAVSLLDGAAERAQVAGDRPQERRLAAAVRPDDGHLLVAVEVEIPARDERAVEADGQVVEREDALAAWRADGDAQGDALCLARALDPRLLEPLELLLAVLRLAMLLPHLVAADEVLVLLDGLLLDLERLELLAPHLVPQRPRCAVSDLVGGDLAEGDLPRAVRDVLEEVAVVRHEDEGAREFEQSLLEPVERGEVEVVRRLVEQ